MYIDDLLTEGVISVLTQKLYTEPTTLKVADIKADRVLDNDISRFKGFHVYVHPKDDLGTVPSQTQRRGRVSIGTHQIGGGQFFTHVYVVHFVLQFDLVSQDRARERANEIFARGFDALHEMMLPINPANGQPKDDFGEGIMLKELGEVSRRSSGTSGSYFWEFEQTISFFTFKP